MHPMVTDLPNWLGTKSEKVDVTRIFIMQTTLIRITLVVAVSLLALATWLNDVAMADAMFIFAAFSIGGIWSKYSGLSPDTD